MILVLMVISIAIGVSPIVDYFYAHGAEEVTSSAVESTTSDTAPITSEGEEAPRVINQTAVMSAVVLSTGTILIALMLFYKRRNPDD